MNHSSEIRDVRSNELSRDNGHRLGHSLGGKNKEARNGKSNIGFSHVYIKYGKF